MSKRELALYPLIGLAIGFPIGVAIALPLLVILFRGTP